LHGLPGLLLAATLAGPSKVFYKCEERVTRNRKESQLVHRVRRAANTTNIVFSLSQTNKQTKKLPLTFSFNILNFLLAVDYLLYKSK